MNKWLKIVHSLAGHCLALPCRCLFCFKPSQRSWALCEPCEAILPWLGNACRLCALPLPASHALCQKCQHQPPAYDSLQALFQYQWPVSTLISQFKYAAKLEFGNLLAHLMDRLIPVTAIDCIIPMPLHPQRQRQRGFNQTLELARVIANTKRMTLDRWSCTRQKATLMQASLNAKKRHLNLKENSFRIDPKFNAQHVLIIEDVVTTGATIHAFALALKNKGVKTVEIWSCGRTILTK